MKPTYIYFLLVLLFFSAKPSLAQEDDQAPAQESPEVETPPAPKRYYVLSPRVSVTVPHPIKNTSFKKCFVGIYEASAGLNFYVYKGLFLGATYKNGLLKITENKINDYNASLTINNVGVKLGGDVYVGEKNKVIFSAALTAGQSSGRYSGLVAKDKSRVLPSTYTCTYYEPEVNLFFLIESNFGIGATISYSVFNRTFDPYELALNDWTQFPKSISGKTQYYSFGFGFYYSLWSKKKNKQIKRVDNNG